MDVKTNRLNFIHLLATPFFIFVLPLFADDSVRSLPNAPTVTCELNDKVRRIMVNYAQGSRPVPCQVHYYKDTEEPGSIKIPWNALNAIGYCEQKAKEMVDSLEESGWKCTEEDFRVPGKATARVD